MRLGIDLDGCLADFNHAFIERIKTVTGRNLFPDNYEPQTWNYPEALGYTAEEVSRVWAGIKDDRFFWYSLPPYKTTGEDLLTLAHLTNKGHDVYFVTARPGVIAKRQTEHWIMNQCSRAYPIHPTVLISSNKAAIADGLELDAYIDDRWENVWAVDDISLSYVLDRPWNRGLVFPTAGRVQSVTEMINKLGLLSIG